jgi:hypothetical protein
MNTKWILILLCVCCATVSADYKIDWYTINGGGGTMTGGQYKLTGTIGQPDAGYSAQGDIEVLGGFWPGGPICTVTLEDFAKFAQYWLDSPCDAGNTWCGGADLNQTGSVGMDDFAEFVNVWMQLCPYGWPLK